MKVVRIALLTLFAAAAVCASASEADDRALAMKFYPRVLDQRFREEFERGDIVREVTTLRTDLENSGREDFLIAAYANGVNARLRIIRTGSDPKVVAESANDTMSGYPAPVIESLDVDHDGRPEIAIEFPRETWLYRFANGQLSLYSGTSEAHRDFETTNLGGADVMDIDGDGRLEILERIRDPLRQYVIAWLDSTGAFREDGYAAWYGTYAPAVPHIDESHFCANPQADYILTIVNGDQDGGSKVSSAVVTLNGAEVVSSRDISASTRVVSVPVKLQEINTVTVHVQGEKGTMITIAVVEK